MTIGKKPKAIWLKTFPEQAQKLRPENGEKRKTGNRRAGERRQYIREKKKFISANPKCAVNSKHSAIQIHHKFGRRGRLLRWQPGWVQVCQNCHSWIHAHILEARVLGLMCEAGNWNNERALTR